MINKANGRKIKIPVFLHPPMHEPDQEPSRNLITDKRMTAQWMSQIALFVGLGLSIIGAALAILSGLFGFFLFSLPGIVLAILTMNYSKNIHDERARNKAALAIILNIILFLVLFIIFIFVKEAGKAMVY